MALNSMVAGSRMASSERPDAESPPDDGAPAHDGGDATGGGGDAPRRIRGQGDVLDDGDTPSSPPRVSLEHQTSIVSAFFPSITNWYAELDKRKALTVLVLVFVNLINYMDRSTVAGMIDSIRKDPDFNIHSDKYLGLLQTAFVICYMIFAPAFGYLGDRYDRGHIMLFGLSLWSASTLIGSLMRNFWWFMVFRALVGIGEASYSTIAPAIISDLFSKDRRSQVLKHIHLCIFKTKINVF